MSVVAMLKLLHVYLLASVKYFVTFPYALLIGLNFTQAIIAVTVGGISGFFFFYYLSGFLLRYYHQHHQTIYCAIKKYIRVDLCHRLAQKEERQKPLFSKRRRNLVKLKTKYGFWGIVVMTPILLSIPLGAYLLNKYYSKQKYILGYMMISIVGWALVFSTIVVILPHHPL